MVVLLLAVFLVVGGVSATRLQDTASGLSRRLWESYNNASLSTLHAVQANLTNQMAQPVDGALIAMEIADVLSRELAAIKAALLDTADVGEDLYSRHRNQQCCSSTCQYGTGYDASLCSMSCNSSSIQYTSSGRRFGIETGQNGTRQCVMGSWEQEDECGTIDIENDDNSAVHVPRDMYDEDPDVLCFVQWTEQLMEQFANNSLYLNSTIVQYVGSRTRLLRFSPPSDWSSLSQCDRCPLTLQDTFELGRRPWYTNTVAGDKSFMLLLDVSGSMAGFQSILARTTIAQLLKALTPNDFFQIVQVGEGERTGRLGCFTNKTRATPENVLVMTHTLMSLDDTNNVGRAQFTAPLREALLLLGNSTECHRVLIVFTDGERETRLPDDIIRETNVQDKVQVFTFLVGYGPDRANLETVACQNRGLMGCIREYSDIIPAVLLITDSLKLNQPPNSTDVHFTAYRDIHGHITMTMGQPLWTAGDDSREAFGIIGFDIDHQLLLSSALGSYRIGASGYGFIVDNNGQLLNHPSISLEYIQDLSDDELLSLEVDLYEHAVNKTQWRSVRAGMLGGGRGQHSLLTWSTLEREESYVLRNTTYSYAAIDDTPYVVVIVTPADLWVVTPPTTLPNVSDVFIAFSPLGGRGQWVELQGVEGQPHRPTHLTVFNGGCDNTVLLMRTLALTGHVVGVVGTSLLPGVIDDLLADVVREEGEGGEGEVYVIDESATVVAASPHNKSGSWLPALYPDLSLTELFINDHVSGYELRPSQEEGEGEGEGGEGEEGCECESLVLYVKKVEVYQMKLSVETQLDCGNPTLSCTAVRVPNTSLTLVALSGPGLLSNTTERSRPPIRLQCVLCVCDCQSCDKYRRSHDRCPAFNQTSSLCGSLRTHPFVVIVIATVILVSLIQLS